MSRGWPRRRRVLRWVPAAGSGQLILLLTVLLAAPTAGQSPVPETGSEAAGLLLRQLDGVKRVLVIGAHPDDEDTALLTVLARGMGARAAYLSLTRGEGGQDLIGPELFEALGIVRTGELLAARRLDGAEQYFTRAFDFGYSKTAEESFRHWPRDSLLSDIVWVVRRFRPQVIVSIFSGTPADGHGQHQVAGILTKEAFDAAGDPARFPEQLSAGVGPWTPLKLYRRTFRDPQNATLVVPTGRLDPLLGRSYHQIAMAGRSQHRSQDFGVAQAPGPFATRLKLVESRVAETAGAGLFAGVDTTLIGLLKALPPATREATSTDIAVYRKAVSEARGKLLALAPQAAVPPLARSLVALRKAMDTLRGLEADAPGNGGCSGLCTGSVQRELARKERLVQEALLAAASVSLNLRADDDIVVPGQTFTVTAEVWNAGPFRIETSAPQLHLPAGWNADGPVHVPWTAPRFFAARGSDGAAKTSPEPDRGGVLEPGSIRRSRLSVHVPAAAQVSELHYLRRKRVGSLYQWTADPDLRSLPRDPPLMSVGVTLRVEAEGSGPPLQVQFERPVRYRGINKARGEFWRPVLVAPSISVDVSPDELIWPLEDPGPRHLQVSVRGLAPSDVAGAVMLELPPAWEASPSQHSFHLEAGATAAFAFEIQPTVEPTSQGQALVRAVARLKDGSEFSRSVTLISYPHIQPALLFGDAVARVHRFPVRVAEGRRLGYVMGSGDDGPAEIRQLGLNVELLGPEQVRAGAFDGLNVIVLGIRAYETRPDLRAANDRLLEWVRGGGTLVVQYNKREIVTGAFAPYSLHMNRPADRVTDEKAAVRLLDPDAPPLAEPNRITPDDFRGWIQERGLYFPDTWAPEYTPLLAMSDPGEKELRGSLLVASLGSGVYVYTSLSLFRQLPAGVPGAYRLLANLLSLEPAAWRAYQERGAPGSDR